MIQVQEYVLIERCTNKTKRAPAACTSLKRRKIDKNNKYILDRGLDCQSKTYTIRVTFISNNVSSPPATVEFYKQFLVTVAGKKNLHSCKRRLLVGNS